MTTTTQLLRLLHLAGPALPIGAYAYSQGLESAVEHGWVNSEDAARGWIVDLLEQVLARTDLPLLARLHAAWQARDPAAVNHWNATLLALRESSELRLEDTQLGTALARLLRDQGCADATPWGERDDTTFANMLALAAAHWELNTADAMSAYAWAWCENQIAAAIKLVPLGQTAGQRIVQHVIAAIPRTVEAALALDDDELGYFAPRLALGSAWHEEQYSRLFRS
jgi:urease accessory protein